MLDDVELKHLRRCVELATEALEAGDEPFGSVLVSPWTFECELPIGTWAARMALWPAAHL